MKEGERQVAPTLAGIRRDHVARYEWAAGQIARGSAVVDFACGVGYGTHVLARAGCVAVGFDKDAEAIAYAKEHYGHELASFYEADAVRTGEIGQFDVAVCFETIEHIGDPLPLLKALRGAAAVLLASVPNEEVFPWNGHAYHFRHYTKAEFEDLLAAAGWKVESWYGQAGPESEVESECAGRTLIARAVRAEAFKRRTRAAPARRTGKLEHVAILGLGPSVRQYLEITKRQGGRRVFCDEVWTINALGDIFECDRVFHMDDVRIQEVRARAAPKSNIAVMLAWLKKHPGPIITSRARRGYPGLVEFPLEAVVNDVPEGYFNSTAAYAVAYAVHLKVKRITCFGMDFTYPSAHDAEKGRACVEFWLGVAAARGIQISVPQGSTLLDAVHPLVSTERFYGYDCVELEMKREGGRIRVGMTERRQLPSAEEIEARYDHSKHPSELVEAGER